MRQIVLKMIDFSLYLKISVENVLKDSLGEYTVMSEIKHPKLMVSAVIADRKPVDLHLFRNYKPASDILGITTPSSMLKQ